MMTEFYQATPGQQIPFSSASTPVGALAPALSESGSERCATEVALFSVALNSRRFARTVPRLTVDINRAVSDAIEAVVTPAANKRLGRTLNEEEMAALGMREERQDDATGQFETEFFIRVNGRYETIAFLVATPVDGGVLIEAEAGSNFDVPAEVAA